MGESIYDGGVDEEGELVNVATETFKYGIIPWAGRRYEDWVRAWVQPHPRDERGLVQVPRPIWAAFQ